MEQIALNIGSDISVKINSKQGNIVVATIFGLSLRETVKLHY